MPVEGAVHSIKSGTTAILSVSSLSDLSGKSKLRSDRPSCSPLRPFRSNGLASVPRIEFRPSSVSARKGLYGRRALSEEIGRDLLAVDVVGYSRLMEADEAGTLARLKCLHSELLDPKTEQYGGRIFEITGDGALAKFGIAIDAVQLDVAFLFSAAITR